MTGGKLEYSKQIHLRFGFYEHTAQKDALPPNLALNINAKPAQLPVRILNRFFIKQDSEFNDFEF